MSNEVLRIKNFKKLKEHRDKKQLLGSSFVVFPVTALRDVLQEIRSVMVARRVA